MIEDLPNAGQAQVAPRATAFIVTLYGDVALPRGGVLWMGTLIACCAAHGLSESLVRTAVSRLVSAGQLEGDRIGRRSYYRLSQAAAAEYGRAGQLFYARPPDPTGWLLAVGPVPDPLPSRDWVPLGAGAALAPNREDVPRPGGALMSCETVAGVEDLPDFAAAHWPLGAADAGYRDVLQEFGPLEASLAAGVPGGAEALALRLRLIHRYRQAALADPRLPVSALPAHWSGAEARRLFVRLYLRLTDQADAYVGEVFRDSSGLLPVATEATRRRKDRLMREAAR